MPKVKKLLFSADILVPYEKLCNQFKLFQNWMIFRGGQNAFSFPIFEKKVVLQKSTAPKNTSTISKKLFEKVFKSIKMNRLIEN